MVQKIRYLKRIKQTIDSLVKNIKSINASPWRQHIPFFALNKEIEKQPLRLGLLSLDQLERHAKSLAAKHEITAGLGQESLLHRLAFNEKMMQVAYSRLNIAVLAKTEISPAGEWLLDNFVLIEEQIRTARRHLPKGYCRELPHLVNGPSAGYPRVYDIAMEVIAHVDGRVDKENISAFINAYQQIKLLKLGEFWAIPIMLRLALIENLSRIAANVVRSMDDREIANQWADQLLHYVEHDPGNLILVAADMARSQPPMSNSFVAELMRRLAGQGSSMDIPLAWIEQHLLERGQSTQQLVQREGQEQAASQVAVGASIGSLRFLGAIDWGEFVEAASLVEQHLRLDPAGIYEKMDFVTRDHYRHVIEDISRNSTLNEWEISLQAIALAREQSAHADEKFSHVGYYLIDRGSSLLRERSVPKRPRIMAWRRFIQSFRLQLYFLGLAVLTFSLCFGLLAYLWPALSDRLTVYMLGIILLLGFSQVALSLINWLTILLCKPHILPRMDFSRGIPPEFRSLVVIPSMLINRRNIENLLESIEVHYLANRDENLHFALLTDFADSNQQSCPEDKELLEQVQHGILALNAKYPKQTNEIFCLFHRNRSWNDLDKIWMGHERKRGKLEALNAYLRKVNHEPSFSLTIENLAYIKFVITLDTDTQMPRDAARKMIATLAHPLNQAHFDPKLGRVSEGYGILQPRIAYNLPSSRRSRFVRIYARNAGLDPYTRLVSDVYQDLFFEGSFCGKGIYDIDAVNSSLLNKLPNNLILSHDLIEGCYARSGLVSDVELFEDFPFHYGEDIARRSRWIRGDWQIIAWLFSNPPSLKEKSQKNPLSQLSKWKIFDNLRRSLVPMSILIALFLSWTIFDSIEYSIFLTAAVLSMIFLPALLATLTEAARKPAEISLRSHLCTLISSSISHLTQATLAIAFLPFEAFINFNALIRSCLRMFITHKHLLEWKSACNPLHSTHSEFSKFYRNMLVAPFIAFIGLIGLYFWRTQNLIIALPFLMLWFLSPLIAHWISRPTPAVIQRLTRHQTQSLHRISRKTWRFFETFVGPDENWLPPDNFQEYPISVLAHRTSPTNMGLSLLANLAAYDFGYLSAEALIERCSHSLTTMANMERFRAHFYNWYDTKTLKPLLPLYVSMVDSGNLAGMLLTLSQGIKNILEQKIICPQLLHGLNDTLHVLEENTTASLKNISLCLKNTPKDLKDWQILGQDLSRLFSELKLQDDEEAIWWAKAFEQQFVRAINQSLLDWAPWSYYVIAAEKLSLHDKALELRQYLDSLREIPSYIESELTAQKVIRFVDEILLHDSTHVEWLMTIHNAAKKICQRAATIHADVEDIVSKCQHMSKLEYGFIYDRCQHLLSIGYNVSEHRRDSGFYDLLASEARIGSFIAIAQGSLPQEHWFALGRQLTTWNSQATLISWSGSMFEYLMPLLIMPSYKDSLLDQSYQTSVKRQISYGAERGIPWGISESGYNITDMHLNYQYRAFGVPGLGLKRGLGEDLVVAPYASILALMVQPLEACLNIQRMQKAGFEGLYGFYEAIDYTPSRLPSKHSHAIIRSYMAHHQGMIFLALGNHLHDNRMQRRFIADPQFRATELLLHERLPKGARIYPHAPEVTASRREIPAHEPDLRVIDTANTPRPEVHLLSNGRYTVMISNSGGGYSRWKNIAVTRWREDPTCDNWGTFCYLRDLNTGEVWSATHQPSLKISAHYEAIFPQARAEFRRRDHGIEMHTEITVSPEDDIELRRFSLTNLTNQIRIIEITSYAEVVLSSSADDDAHPAFNNLFVQTEIIAHNQAILCKRRPRSQKELTPTMLHLMTIHGTVIGKASYETDRSRFIGRGGSINDPIVMRDGQTSSLLSGQQGSVLDPIVAIRHRIVIKPEQTARVHIVSGIGETRADALALIEKYHDRHVADRVFELAWTHRQVALRQLNISEADAQLYGRLASSVLYSNPLRRANPNVLTKNRRGQSGLWGYGISGDLAIVLLRIGSPNKIEIVRQLIQAQSYWQTMGLAVDLVIWNEDESGYRQELNDRIMELITAGKRFHSPEGPGRIFVCRSEQLSEDDRILLQTVARAILLDSNGTLATQILRRKRSPVLIPALVPSQDQAPSEPSPPETLMGDLLFPNGLGGFSEDGREYRIISSPNKLTPAPWSNIVANQYFGTVISESGSAYTWCENAHEFRLTPWNNDALTDSSGEAFYIRDEESGSYWSPTPLPARAIDPYLTRHGFGYSAFELNSQGIYSKLTSFVAIDAPVKITLIKIRNLSSRTRKLSLTAYCEWVLGKHRAKSLMHIVSEDDPATGAILARNPYHAEFGGRLAFFNVSEKTRSITADRSEFLGRNGQMAKPAAMSRQNLSGRTGAGFDPCGAIQTALTLDAGEEYELVFVLGMARDLDDARTLLQRFTQTSDAHLALEAVQEFWEHTLGSVQVKTPDPSINILVNGWLVYQTLACRIWARSGYYQSGGAFGFRDQLQDAMSLIHCQAPLLRSHILRCAARQFREGDVQHWWHPPSGLGVRTHFSDDYLWLPLATSRYVLALGDTGILDERVHFIEGRQVKLDEEAYSEIPTQSDESATLYEHCVRSLRYGMKYGQHGLPLMGCGDWNDGMNLVGEHGKGESVWLAFFLYEVLSKFSAVARLHGDGDFENTCLSEAAKIKVNIETHAWDGEWYRRAYFDDGQPLGSRINPECQIDSIPQSWSVLSGAASPERSRTAMEIVDQRLVDRSNGLVKLFDPPFDSSDLNPGYIKGYPPGIRENGAQYTHAAIWMAMAFAKMGDQIRAWELLNMINPLHHSDSAQKIAQYMVEPYVMAADVYSVSPHIGRGGWTWYTGSAAWMYRLILESLLGLRLENEQIFVSPCIPHEWSGFELHYRFRSSTYKINIEISPNPVMQIHVDGILQEGEGIKLIDDQSVHSVHIKCNGKRSD